MNIPRSMGLVRAAAALLMALLIALIHWVAPGFFPSLISMLSHGDILETAEYIQSFGAWALFFSFWLTLFVNALGFPPAIIFSTANTLIFGIVPGIVLSCIAETVGVTISFLLLRFLFRDAAEKIIRKSKYLDTIDHYSGQRGFTVMLIARMIPYIPSALLNAVGALSSLSLRDYVLASLIGKFPSTGIEAIIGHDTILMEENPVRLVVVVILAIALIAWAWIYQRKHQQNIQGSEDKK